MLFLPDDYEAVLIADVIRQAMEMPPFSAERWLRTYALPLAEPSTIICANVC